MQAVALKFSRFLLCQSALSNSSLPLCTFQVLWRRCSDRMSSGQVWCHHPASPKFCVQTAPRGKTHHDTVYLHCIMIHCITAAGCLGFLFHSNVNEELPVWLFPLSVLSGIKEWRAEARLRRDCRWRRRQIAGDYLFLPLLWCPAAHSPSRLVNE